MAIFNSFLYVYQAGYITMFDGWSPFSSPKNCCTKLIFFGTPKSGDVSSHVPINMRQCEAPKIAKLVYNSNNYGLWYL